MTILIKNSTVAGKVPLPADLQIGELAMNSADGSLFMKLNDGTIKTLIAPPVLQTTSVATTLSGSPFVEAWKVDSTTGFGAKYSTPSPTPLGYGYSTAFSPNQKVIAVGSLTPTPFVACYAWNNDTGFGTKYADPVTPPTNSVYGVVFNSTGDRIALAINGSPYVEVYEWNDITGFGNKFAAPNVSGLSGGNSNGVAIAPDNKSISVTISMSPWIVTWAWDNTTGFGARYADPAGAEGDTYSGISISYSPASDALIMSTGVYPAYIQGWKWNSVTGYGTKYANAAQNPSTVQVPLSFSPDGQTISFPTDSSAINAIRFNSVTGFGTRYTQQTAIGTIKSANWTRDGKAIIVTYGASPFVAAYAWTNAVGFGTRFANPSSAGSAAPSNGAVN